MKSRLTGIQITAQPDKAQSVPNPVIILDEKIQKSLSTISPRHRDKAQEYAAYKLAQGLKKKSILVILKAIAALEAIGKDHQDITKLDMVAWVNLIEQTYSQATAQVYKVLAKNYLGWLHNNGQEDGEYPESVRWMRIKKPKESYGKPVLSKEEVFRLVQQAKTQRDRALMFCLYESGARASEILSLSIQDIHISQGWAEIMVNGKTGQRRIPLVESVPDLQLWLSMHPASKDPNAPLWPTGSRGKKRMSYPTLFWLVSTLAQRAGLPKGISPHSLRHASATHKAAVFKEFQMREYFGWSRTSTMPSRYVHLSGRDLDTAMREYNGLPDQKDSKETSPTRPKPCPRCRAENSALAAFCIRCGSALEVKTAVELEARVEKADSIQAMLNQFLIQRAPELIREFLGQAEIRQSIEEVLGGGLNSNNPELKLG